MAPRAYWKGYLKLSLVSCAVALYPAVSTSRRTTFHTLNRATGNRVKRQFIDAATGEPVPGEAQVKGYEVAEGQHVIVEDDEIEAIRIESTHTIDIDSFARRSEVDGRYLDTPYYLAPEDRIAQEAFAVIREAMRRNGLVGLARVALQRRERILMLEPLGPGLVGTTLHYRDEVRDEAPYFEGIEDMPVAAEMLELATHIMQTKAGRFDPDRFRDRYEEALVALVRDKRQGREPVMAQPERPSNVIDLLEALRRSVSAGSAGEPPRKAVGGKTAGGGTSVRASAARAARPATRTSAPKGKGGGKASTRGRRKAG